MVGPIIFIAAWAVMGATAAGHDPTRDAISRLAALGAPTRPAMTAGLVALGAGIALYGFALRPSPTWALPVASGALTLVVAALPLESRYDTAHGVAATLGYATLAAVPVVVGSRYARPVWARMSVATGLVSGALLLASVLVSRDGLYQRMGLTVAQLWVAISALGLLRSPVAARLWR